MEEGQEQKRSSRRNKKIWLAISIVTLVIIVAAVPVYYFVYRVNDPIPRAIKEQAGFTLFYPSKLPPTYKIDTESFQYNEQRVTYTISSPSQPRILVTIQPKPTDYDTENFNQKLPGRSSLNTDYGSAVIGQVGSGKLGSLVSDDVWVLISAPKEVRSKAFNEVTKSLSSTDGN